MKIEVRYFASLVERAGCPTESLEIADETSVEQLWGVLLERHPLLRDLSYRPLVACDLEYSDWDRKLGEVREVAFLPPVSGG